MVCSWKQVPSGRTRLLMLTLVIMQRQHSLGCLSIYAQIGWQGMIGHGTDSRSSMLTVKVTGKIKHIVSQVKRRTAHLQFPAEMPGLPPGWLLRLQTALLPWVLVRLPAHHSHWG